MIVTAKDIAFKKKKQKELVLFSNKFIDSIKSKIWTRRYILKLKNLLKAKPKNIFGHHNFSNFRFKQMKQEIQHVDNISNMGKLKDFWLNFLRLEQGLGQKKLNRILYFKRYNATKTFNSFFEIKSLDLKIKKLHYEIFNLRSRIKRRIAKKKKISINTIISLKKAIVLYFELKDILKNYFQKIHNINLSELIKNKTDSNLAEKNKYIKYFYYNANHHNNSNYNYMNFYPESYNLDSINPENILDFKEFESPFQKRRGVLLRHSSWGFFGKYSPEFLKRVDTRILKKYGKGLALKANHALVAGRLRFSEPHSFFLRDQEDEETAHEDNFYSRKDFIWFTHYMRYRRWLSFGTMAQHFSKPLYFNIFSNKRRDRTLKIKDSDQKFYDIRYKRLFRRKYRVSNKIYKKYILVPKLNKNLKFKFLKNNLVLYKYFVSHSIFIARKTKKYIKDSGDYVGLYSSRVFTLKKKYIKSLKWHIKRYPFALKSLKKKFIKKINRFKKKFIKKIYPVEKNLRTKKYWWVFFQRQKNFSKKVTFLKKYTRLNDLCFVAKGVRNISSFSANTPIKFTYSRELKKILYEPKILRFTTLRRGTKKRYKKKINKKLRRMRWRLKRWELKRKRSRKYGVVPHIFKWLARNRAYKTARNNNFKRFLKNRIFYKTKNSLYPDLIKKNLLDLKKEKIKIEKEKLKNKPMLENLIRKVTLKKDFVYNSILYNRYFNSFIKEGKKQKAEFHFFKIFKNLKKTFQHYLHVFYEEIFLKKYPVYIKLIRKGKFLYRVPYQSLKHRIPINSTKVIKKNKNVIKTRVVKILWDRESLINLIYDNRTHYHFRWRK